MLVHPLNGPLIRWFVSPHITSKTSYVAIASRREEGRVNQLMLKTGYIEIASHLVTVARSCFYPIESITSQFHLKTKRVTAPSLADRGWPL
jgi:hypothetical protein